MLAVKVVDKKALTEEERELLRTEIAILKLVRHPHIIRLEGVFETGSTMYIVMELLRGGELFDSIVGRERFSEEEARTVVKPLVEALAYLHSLGVTHRDLKPENVLVGDGLHDLKIADFGLSKLVHPRELMTQPVGTLSYVAPEVLSMQGYNRRADLWSLGVILYLIVRGKLPFDADSKEEVIHLTLSAELDWDESPWTEWSQEGRDFAKSMLERNHKKRITARRALQHPWLTGETFADRRKAAKRAARSRRAAAAGGKSQRKSTGDRDRKAGGGALHGGTDATGSSSGGEAGRSSSAHHGRDHSPGHIADDPASNSASASGGGGDGGT